MFLDCVYFSPTCFSLPFSPCQVLCLLCLLVSITLLANFLLASLCSGDFFPSRTPLAFVLPGLLYVFSPMSGRMWLVLLAAVAVVCLQRPGIGRVSDRLSRGCKDWGHLNLSVHRASVLQLVVMARPCISSLFDSRPPSFPLSASFAKVPFPVSSTHAFLLKFGQICSQGRKDGVLGRAIQQESANLGPLFQRPLTWPCVTWGKPPNSLMCGFLKSVEFRVPSPPGIDSGAEFSSGAPGLTETRVEQNSVFRWNETET